MPKLKTLQIVWHGKEPVYSLDFHPNGLLVTSGADKEIKIWKVCIFLWIGGFKLRSSSGTDTASASTSI
jgi:chromatin assembly factor 1 subunit B